MSTRVEIRQEHSSPLKSQHLLAIVFICSITVFILMSVCLMSSYWITSEGFRQGLLYLCIEAYPNQYSRHQYGPLPFDLNKDELEPGCYPNRDVGEYHFGIISIIRTNTIFLTIPSSFQSHQATCNCAPSFASSLSYPLWPQHSLQV